MTLSSALSISLSGLKTSTLQLEQTASNISNAATEGYTTKTVNTSSAMLGTIGGGVQVTGYTRAENTALFTTLSTATSDASYRAKQDEYLQQVMDILGTSSSDDPTLSETLSNFVNSWNNLSATPESLVNQRQVISDATTFCDEVKRIAQAVEALDRQCSNEIDSTIEDLNSYLTQIRDLNLKIAQAENANLSSGDLQDERDQLVLKVSEIVGVSVMQRGSGQIALYTDTGYQLVDGDTVRNFTYDGVDVTDVNNPSLSLNSALSGGSLQALVDFRTDTSASGTVSTDQATSVIQKLRDQLDEITNAFLTTTTTATSGEVTFATAYNNATTQAGQLAQDFFTGTNRTNFSVNSALIDGTSDLKFGAAAAVSDALLDATRAFSADGLDVSGASYSTLVTSSLVAFQQAASNISTLSDTASNSHQYLKEKLSNETGVNTDNELVKLVEYQNAYSASAHVMSVVQDLFDTLMQLL